MYSFGAGEDISFDIAVACMFQFEVKLYDPSPAAKRHVEYAVAVVGKSHADAAEDKLHRVAGTRPSDKANYWHKVRMTPIKSSALEMHDLGVGNADGNLTFYHSRNQAAEGSWSLDPGMRSAGGATITVPIRTIEHIMGDATPAAVKLDVEGLENDILKRLLEKGSKAPPVIFVDFDSICCCLGTPAYCAAKKAEGEAMVRQMQAAGYQLFRQFEGGGDYTFWRQPQQ
jgi:FkbM family methyltransferase